MRERRESVELPVGSFEMRLPRGYWLKFVLRDGSRVIFWVNAEGTCRLVTYFPDSRMEYSSANDAVCIVRRNGSDDPRIHLTMDSPDGTLITHHSHADIPLSAIKTTQGTIMPSELETGSDCNEHNGKA